MNGIVKDNKRTTWPNVSPSKKTGMLIMRADHQGICVAMVGECETDQSRMKRSIHPIQRELCQPKRKKPKLPALEGLSMISSDAGSA